MDFDVEMKELHAGYGSTAVLENISAGIKTGTITVILGQSGCGKSTLLKTILGLIPPLGGSLELLGKETSQLDEAAHEALLKNIGVLFQNGGLLSSMNLLDNIALPLVQHTDLPEEIIEKMVRLMLQRVGLGEDLWKFPGELSGGMRKRAALARSLIMNPAILFCDEPSAGLDPVTAEDLDNLLVELRSQFNMTMVVVTHELASIHRIAEELIFLHDGAIAFQGPLEEAKESSTKEVREFFKAGTF